MENTTVTSKTALAEAPAPAIPQPRTSTAPKATTRPGTTEQPMELGVQKSPPSAAQPGAVRQDLPASWGIAAMPMGDKAPFSRREGGNLIVSIVANAVVVFTQRFAEEHAYRVAGDFGLPGKPVIVQNNRPYFPVDAETYMPLSAAKPGCKWLKEIVLTTRG